MELTILDPSMADLRFRAGSYYTIEELAELARRELEARGLTHREAADILNEKREPTRGRFHRPQVSAAFADPAGNPGMVLLLLETFTSYGVDERPRYQLVRRDEP